ncbi:hypothetical protein T439DRAFT_180102 [Meredithblackwellia eburnea MCA 4105]
MNHQVFTPQARIKLAGQTSNTVPSHSKHHCQLPMYDGKKCMNYGLQQFSYFYPELARAANEPDPNLEKCCDGHWYSLKLFPTIAETLTSHRYDCTNSYHNYRVFQEWWEGKDYLRQINQPERQEDWKQGRLCYHVEYMYEVAVKARKHQEKPKWDNFWKEKG